MAKIVCIAEGTVRPGICEIGDIVSIHDDDANCSGSGYEYFTVLSFPGLTAVQVRESFVKIRPEEAVIYKTTTPADEWSLDRPEEGRVWKALDGKWMFLDAVPKYRITLADLTGIAKASLEDSKIDATARLLTIESQAKEKIALDAKNLVEAVDLNKVIAEEPK